MLVDDSPIQQSLLSFVDWDEKDGASIESPNSKVTEQNIHSACPCQQISICAINTKTISSTNSNVKMCQ